MFDYYQKSFFMNKTVFNDDPIIGLGVFKVEKTKNKKKIFPYSNTSSGKNKIEIFGKLYNEFLERFKMVNNYRSNKKTEIILINGLKKTLVKRNVLTYGYDSKYGHKDTTGTASGLNSAILIEKAICELLEKNELMLMWYKKLCSLVKITPAVKAVLLQYGINEKNIKIFYAQNISNIHTIIVFILNDNLQIIGSGISGDKDVMHTLVSAIEEALMQKWMDELSPKSMYLKNNKKFDDYFFTLCNVKQISIENLKSVQKIIINPPFDDIEVGLLNIAGCRREITIKAISKTMFNCIPTISNIRKNKTRVISVLYGIEKELKNAVECAVI